MLENVKDMKFFKKYIRTDVPVCPKCEIERFRLTGRGHEYARCPECIEKLTKDYTWVKCPCGEEYSYLVFPNSGEVDYNRTGEHTICVKCYNAKKALEKQALAEIEDEDNTKKGKFKNSFMGS